MGVDGILRNEPTGTERRQDIPIARISLALGIGGFWVNDQPAIQAGAEPDGFFFRGNPLSQGFEAIREPSVAYCVSIELAGGQLAYGDCTTVLNAGYAGRPQPLRAANLPRVQADLKAAFDGKSFPSFRDAAKCLETLELEQTLAIPVAFGVSQALLSAAAVVRGVTMAQVLMDEFDVRQRYDAPGFAGSCGGDWQKNVDKAIARRVDMFPQSAIQTPAECQRLPDFVSWILGRIEKFGASDYKPDLHFDFHASLGRMLGNDEDKVCAYLSEIVERAKPYQVYFEDPLLAETAAEACERMGRLRERLDTRGPHCHLIADEWANAPGEMKRFAQAKAAHAIQIKMPDNGSILKTIEAIQLCRENDILPYLGGSCNETDISSRVTVHIGMAFGAWRMLTKPGLGFDEGLMVMTNEMNRTFPRLGR